MHCELCGINLEIDFDDEDGMVCAQCKSKALPSTMEDALKAALKWWDEDAKYLTEWVGDGETGDEQNVFNGDPGWVVAARKLLTKPSPNSCEYFEIVDWDEDTNEIIHAVCTFHSSCWPNCNRCQHKVEYMDVADNRPALLSSAGAKLFHTDIELLGKNPNAMVRQEPADDAKVKRLYNMWKSL